MQKYNHKKIEKMRKINILGVNITNLGKKETLSEIEKYLYGNRPHFLTTPNAEIILEALQDKQIFEALNKADLAVPDTITLKYASWVLGKNIKRFPGADLTKEILNIAEKLDKKVAIINWVDALSGTKDIQNSIKKYYPKLSFFIEEVPDINEYEKHTISQNMRDFNPEIIFVTFGGGKQEKFIYKKILKNSSLSNLKLAIGVGGAFDFLTGNTKRAPKWMRFLGLEWFWRMLIKQNLKKGTKKIVYPWRKRMKRIWNAVIVFPVRFAYWRFFIKK